MRLGINESKDAADILVVQGVWRRTVSLCSRYRNKDTGRPLVDHPRGATRRAQGAPRLPGHGLGGNCRLSHRPPPQQKTKFRPGSKSPPVITSRTGGQAVLAIRLKSPRSSEPCSSLGRPAGRETCSATELCLYYPAQNETDSIPASEDGGGAARFVLGRHRACTRGPCPYARTLPA